MNVQPIFLSAVHVPHMRNRDEGCRGWNIRLVWQNQVCIQGEEATSLEKAAPTENVSSVYLTIIKL